MDSIKKVDDIIPYVVFDISELEDYVNMEMLEKEMSHFKRQVIYAQIGTLYFTVPYSRIKSEHLFLFVKDDIVGILVGRGGNNIYDIRNNSVLRDDIKITIKKLSEYRKNK